MDKNLDEEDVLPSVPPDYSGLEHPSPEDTITSSIEFFLSTCVDVIKKSGILYEQPFYKRHGDGAYSHIVLFKAPAGPIHGEILKICVLVTHDNMTPKFRYYYTKDNVEKNFTTRIKNFTNNGTHYVIPDPKQFQEELKKLLNGLVKKESRSDMGLLRRMIQDIISS